MVFNSIEFIVFLIIVLPIYFLINKKYKSIVLLVSSYYFYMAWKPEYIILIIISTIFNYFIAKLIDKNKDISIKKVYLLICIIFNLTLLFVFKYLNFMIESVNEIIHIFDSKYSINTVNLLLPMGISFFTFQALGYVIDVYKNEIEPENNLIKFSLYITFFPQLVAGPIEKASRLIPQFYEEHKFEYQNVVSGLKRMILGFFKKIVIADRLAVAVDTIYNNPQSYSGLPLILATFAFGVQIYCDFSGYSDIAIGVSKIMGFDIMENFKRPYFSKNISEFWHRWHISLSSWFREYVYIPLGGSRVKRSRIYFNILITFLISGLWHGASWTFVIWGALHGIYLILSRVLKPFRERISDIIKLNKYPRLQSTIRVITTNLLVMFAWIFFRANNLKDAIYIVNNLFVNLNDVFNIRYILNSLSNMGLSNIEVISAILSIIILIIISFIQRDKSISKLISTQKLIVRYFIYSGIIMYMIIFSYVGNSQFIYFQF